MTEMLVREIMTEEVVTCDAEETVQTAADRMLAEHVGSVVVTREGDPAGILTENDALYAGYVTERPFTEIPLDRAMSEPLVTIMPDKTVQKAIDVMNDEQVKKLPVVDGIDLVGILTMVDVARHERDLLREAYDNAARRELWENGP
jgi:CBS domain-containing protein